MSSYWLLDVDYDGRTVRLSEADLDVLTDSGEILHYVSAIEVDTVTESLSFADPSSGSPAASMRIYLPDGCTPLGLIRASAELARWSDADTWEGRRRVLAGRFSSPAISAPEEGLRTTLTQAVWADSASLIAPTQAITAGNWSVTFASLLASDVEIAYPVVIGHPGAYSLPAMVAPWLWHDPQTDTDDAGATGYNRVALLLAGHHVTATTVYLSTEQDLPGFTAHILNTYDDTGQPVAVVPFFYASDLVPNDIYGYDQLTSLYAARWFENVGVNTIFGLGAGWHINDAYNVDDTQPPIFAAWYNADDTAGGGLMEGGAMVRAAGAVLSWAMARSTAGVDRARMSEAVAAFSQYQIDCVIADRAASQPWGWIVNVLLPLLPVALAVGADGMFAVPLMLDGVESDCEARIDTSRPGVARMSDLVWDTSRMIRSVTIRYAYYIRTNGYVHTVKYGSATAAAADLTGETIPDPTLTAGALFRLTAEDLIIETAAVYDEATATLIGAAACRLRGLPFGVVQFDLPEADLRFRALRRGSLVWVVDAETDTERVGQVYQIVTDGSGSIGVGVWLFLDPLRDSLA